MRKATGPPAAPTPGAPAAATGSPTGSDSVATRSAGVGSAISAAQVRQLYVAGV